MQNSAEPFVEQGLRDARQSTVSVSLGILLPKHLLLDFHSVVVISVVACDGEIMDLGIREALIPAPPYYLCDTWMASR